MTEDQPNRSRSTKKSNARGRGGPRRNSLPKPRSYKRVKPRLMDNTSKEAQLARKKQIEEIKAQREVARCTFKPEFNFRSLKMATKNDRTVIQKRDVPDRYKRAIVEEKARTLADERALAELGTMKLPDNSGKNAQKDFYDGKVAWRKQADEKIKAKVEEKTEKEIKSFIGKPKILDYSKNKIVPPEKIDMDDFLERCAKTLKRRVEKRDKVANQMYNFPFKPALYNPRRTGEMGSAE